MSEDMYDGVLQIVMDPVMTDFATFAELEDDAVFEHAVALAQIDGVDVGQPEFDEIFRQVSDKRQDVMQWTYHLAFVSLATIKVLLESGEFELRVNVGEPEEMAGGIATSLSKAAMVLMSSLMHVATGPDAFWTDNSAFTSADVDARSVEFDFQQVGVVRGDA